MNSPKNTLTEQDIKQWGKNLLKFTAPTLAIFFGQLAAGVDWKAALAVALLGLYGAVADIFSKYKSGIDTQVVQPVLPVQESVQIPSDVQQATPVSNAE